MSLELSSLKKAINSFNRSIAVISKKLSEDNQDYDEIETIKAGVIQNFEFTYELCWKFMKRWIESNIGSEIVDGVTRIELFRVSAENRLISDVDIWMKYHRARNQTSHIYDEEISESVFQIAISFLIDAKNLLSNLEKRND
jgi:nucleotidyltransferase substrate binding protein (TIGR01987 family)